MARFARGAIAVAGNSPPVGSEAQKTSAAFPVGLADFFAFVVPFHADVMRAESKESASLLHLARTHLLIIPGVPHFNLFGTEAEEPSALLLFRVAHFVAVDVALDADFFAAQAEKATLRLGCDFAHLFAVDVDILVRVAPEVGLLTDLAFVVSHDAGLCSLQGPNPVFLLYPILMSEPGSPTDIRLIGHLALPANATLLDFWKWAFGDLCDDDLKGYFAEWMVRVLLGLPLTRRVSWADSEIITPAGLRIEVKSSAYWQSWKLVNEDGTRKPVPPPVDPARKKVVFGGLRSGTSVDTSPQRPSREFKSDVYVFCLHTQTDATAWDAWQLSHWEFYVLTRSQLVEHGIGGSISLGALRKLCPPMSEAVFQKQMQKLLTCLPAPRDNSTC
jgi:hypothetical protein